MEIQGLTPIDTLYEFAGYAMSLKLGNYLIWNGYLLGFLLSAALVRLYYLGAREGSFKDLAVYPVYVLFIMFLVWPIEVALTAPRAQTGDSLEEASPENGVFWDAIGHLMHVLNVSDLDVSYGYDFFRFWQGEPELSVTPQQ